MDQIQTMRVFARVVEAGSFTKAAISLDLPKGTVTKLVQHLEARLKVRLLNRTTRRVSVTPDGAAYYERTTRVLNDLDDIEASMMNAHARPSGRLRVDVGTAVARTVVVPALPAFYERYPDIQLDLGVSDRPVNLISDNIDCVIRGGELLDESLVARRIANLEMVTVASPDYLRRHGVPKHPADLDQGHAMLAYFSERTGRFYPDIFVKDGETIEWTGGYKLSVNDGNAHVEGLLQGLGLSQTAAFIAAPYIASGQLVRVLADWACPPIPVHVVYPPNRHLSGKVRAFVEWAVEVFAHLERLGPE